MNQLAKVRNNIVIPSIDSVEVVIGSRDPLHGFNGSSVQASFVCISCDACMLWQTGMFECVSCGFELTAVEASDICLVYLSEMNKLSSLVCRRVGLMARIWRRVRRIFK